MFRKPNSSNLAEVNRLVLKIACLCWLLAKLVSWRVWTTYRLLPAAPLWHGLNQAPPIVHTLLFGLSLALLGLMLVWSNRVILSIVLVVEILSCLLDLNRLQPWEYQYLFIVFIFLVNAYHPERIKVALILVLASTYAYSGLHKLNEGFLHTTWANAVLWFFFRNNTGITHQHWLLTTGYIAGVFEFTAGICLLFAKTRAKAAWLLIALHLFVLLLLGPLGKDFNKVIWPWNIALAAFLYLLFLWPKDRAFALYDSLKGWNLLILLFWGLLPALSFLGYWDKNLSSNLYSGDNTFLFICVQNASACKPLQRFCYPADGSKICKGMAMINVSYWALAETNVPVYSNESVYRAIELKLLQQYPNAGFSFIERGYKSSQ